MSEFKSGLIVSEPNITDWKIGAGPLDFVIINAAGDWSSYLPESEFQNRWGYDRMACVTYSCLNCIETLYKYQTGVDRNFSDRFLAKMSNTSPSGNTLENVFDTARKVGLVDEQIWPDVEGGWNVYYEDIPQSVVDQASAFGKEWNLYREWVNSYNPDDIFLTLKSSPVQVTVKYAAGSEILNPVGTVNHAVTLYAAEKNKYFWIFDHYTQTNKKYDWNYKFGSALKPTLMQKINITPMTIENDTLCQLVQDVGGFGLFIDGYIIVDELDKVLASWVVRNKGDLKGKTKAVTLEEWNKWPKKDLKGNIK
jgi:hypothetical protein